MSSSLLTVSEVNSLTYEDFVKQFGNVVEHCPILAAAVWIRRPFNDVNHLHDEICKVVDDLPALAKQGILRVHPDLAGRLADQGTLTAESADEQKAAGLDTLTTEEKAILRDFNHKYREKFSFPFVVCARLNRKDAILRGIQERYNNSADVELDTGIEEVKKICYLRLLSIVDLDGVESKLP